MDSKGGDFNRVEELVKTGDAFQFDRQSKRAICPKCPFGNSEIQFVLERAGTPDVFGFELRDRAILLAFKMQALGRNLFKVNFHGLGSLRRVEWLKTLNC